MNINIYVADESHIKYAERICELVYISAQERGTGIAKRTPEYVADKMKAGKAVIAITETGDLAGFSYIETWGHKQFVANSGLIVAHAYRKTGLAKRIKQKIFALSRTLYPDAKIFSITTGLAVMKINSELGFRPVPFSELTDDTEFWNGCRGCRNFDILQRNNYKMCLCTGLLYDPANEKKTSAAKQQPDKGKGILSTMSRTLFYPFHKLNKLLLNRKHNEQ
ncbi:MAG: GNAT family N-acetyltransferase [Bacteroidales bacterium]|nr:GNAT family N-acetyltransferase [Bacteroidales bacterium]MDD3201898.1 GNAT family N-acetyltransferase [Bacteroidales bacterium]